MSKDNQPSTFCPSYMAKPGAQLYGIINGNGFINYLNDVIEIDQAFIDEASKGRELEKRFRFAGNCAKNGCNQWDKGNAKCGLIDTIISIVDNNEQETLQYCAIRSKCRWYLQRKGLACAQCSEVIRNLEAKLLEAGDEPL